MTFQEVYDRLNQPSKFYDYFVLPVWRQNVAAFAQQMLPEPPHNFLENRTIIDTMFVTAGGEWLREELEYIEKLSPNKVALADILRDPEIGKPLIMVDKYQTSHNTVHHCYHLERFYEWIKDNEPERASDDDDIIGDVVEWGGGFGSMARLHSLDFQGIYNYTIIDLPIFCAIQWHYLNSLFPGEVGVAFDGKLPDTRITIVPLHHADAVEYCTSFVSTWALSECTVGAHEYVKARDWFGARNLLIAHQKANSLFPNADRMSQIPGFKKTETTEIGFIPGNFYTFATR